MLHRTECGRKYITFYSGGIIEQFGNYAVLVKSDDGINFGEPIAAAVPEFGHRCFDSCVWIDTFGRLWFIWSYAATHGVYASICDNSDANKLVWSSEFYFGHGCYA